MAKYRKKPVVVEAVQFFPADWKPHEPQKYPCGVYVERDGSYYIDTLEGRHIVTSGDWIITGVKDEKYPCKPDIFKLTYESVDKTKAENIKQMRERHEREIKELQDNCEHKEVSECMPFMWAPGHMSYCVKVCEACGKELFTTHRGNYIGREVKVKKGEKKVVWEYINETPKERLFECPKREDCHYYHGSIIKNYRGDGE